MEINQMFTQNQKFELTNMYNEILKLSDVQKCTRKLLLFKTIYVTEDNFLQFKKSSGKFKKNYKKIK